MLRPRPAVLLACAATALLVTACSSGSAAAPSTAPTTSVVTSTAAPATAAPTPVSDGPTTAATAPSCPLVSEAFVHQTVGVRLGRLAVLRSGGRVVGCRFYAQQRPDNQCDATCLAGEHLPGPNQPAVEVTTQRYASATAAHNAFVLSAGTASSVTQTDFAGTTGLCFQTAFDPQDKGDDYACTVNKGATLVLVRTIDTAHTVATSLVLTRALRALPA